ncbi:class I SAM-dependent RNA methyltransferase [Propionibacteriaceae bacterium G1746]|uniref:class I SAM-dependent RNA methyltransferase n=1 Tax=Aestuariimicrobium sp. G57 TaxID=3418485 RepID=UPI003C185DCA
MTQHQFNALPGPGDVVGPVEVGPVAHGGHCVARLDGRVLFVRHAVPGETVTVRLTDTGKAKFWRGDVDEVITASPERVRPPCPVAGTCGGCDFQHVTPVHQRELKRRVVAEQLQRLAGIEWNGKVEQVGEPLGWRSRMRYVTETGMAGLRQHRSHDVVELPTGGCRIADPTGPDVETLHILAREAGGMDMSVAVAEPVSVVAGRQVLQGSRSVREQVRDHVLQVSTDGFWQPHRDAPEVLTKAVLQALKPKAGEVGLDLYCGVGLFAAALANADVRVVGVEQDRRAASWAARNVPGAEIISGPLERHLADLPHAVDIIVLDPPRTGAGQKVVTRLAALRARAICYVACDPAALARDLATFAELGYRAEQVRAFDLFPMTHHIECVALIVPA